MSGYYGYSMSNNAVEAYENGERPLSKWRKSDILEAISVSEIELKCSISKLQKLPVKVLKEVCLTYSSWHHTSNHYNQTNFYTLDEKYIESLTDEKSINYLQNVNQKREKKNLWRRDGSVRFLNGQAAVSIRKQLNLLRKELLKDSGSSEKMEVKRKHLQMDLDLSRKYLYRNSSVELVSEEVMA